VNEITKVTWNGARVDLGARFAIRIGSVGKYFKAFGLG
jgi:hypothetical protein